MPNNPLTMESQEKLNDILCCPECYYNLIKDEDIVGVKDKNDLNIPKKFFSSAFLRTGTIRLLSSKATATPKLIFL